MIIHPIDFRYGTPEMKKVWSEENRFSCIVKAETALAYSLGVCGIISKADADEIIGKAGFASYKRAREIEEENSHEVMAIIQAISEACGDVGRFVHFGATSNDILDTALGLQIKEALDILDEKLRHLLSVLLKRAEETKHLVCIGRTHGQHALPMTYGLRFAVWAAETARHLERLDELRPRVCVGKLTGAVGTMASLGKDGIRVQDEMMKYLNLEAVDVSTQVVSRDRYAEYIFFLANCVTTLEKIAVEIRSLQRTEIGEVAEPFGKNQVGSSAMPHKLNPIKCEQVCGLARIVRGMVEPALLNNTLWDERDLTNSATERITFPEASVLTDHCLKIMANVIGNLTINEEAVSYNLHYLQGVNLAESLMTEAAKRGMARQTAHEIIRKASLLALDEKRPLSEVLEGSEIMSLFEKEEVLEYLNADAYVGLAVEQVESLVSKLSVHLHSAV
ncbi:MAG TPA: adenylosuccinate lyase [Methanocorpusculum sp.]|nr:adenylosuccinate lyase [Methanocorpusculum sp.]HJJ73685.1 adenylosuccinate lyase [Methanocorpusculum sp.]